MGCLVEFTSRLALLALWLATPWVNRAFSGGWILPLLGIIFLPITALSYVIVYALSGGVSGWAWLWVVLAFIIDLSSHGSSAWDNRRRLPRARPSYQRSGDYV
jgi:hypothetical protein